MKHFDHGTTTVIRRTRLPYLRGGQAAGGVTLLRAPIGFGKTTLLRQWHNETMASRGRAGWIDLTPSERSVDGLIATLVERTTLLRDIPTLQSSDSLRDAFSRSLATGYMLFFDGWDEITGSESEELLAALLGSDRTRVHCHIACRREPVLPIETLLADDRLRLISQDALKFSDSEQRRFLGAAEWSALSNNMLAALDGWPLAFKLLKVLDHAADRGHQEPAAFARESGLETIIAAKLDGACCDTERQILDVLGIGGDIDLTMLQEMSGRDDAGALLNSLTALLPFQACLDGRSMRYRLSPLLRPMLGRRFDEMPPARRRAIVGAAYDRSVGLGRTVDALNFALLGGEAEKAVRLIESVGPLRLMMIHGVEPVQDILARLPLPFLPDAFRSRLAIPITYAKRGWLVEAREMVETAVADIEASSLPPARKREALRDAMFARMQIAACSDSDWAFEFERAARGELAKDPAFAAWARACSGIVAHQTGQLDKADTDFLQSELACRQFGAAYQSMHLKLHRAHVDIARGRIRAASRTVREIGSEARSTYANDLGFLAAVDLARFEVGILQWRASVQSETLASAIVRLRQGDGWYEPFASGLTSMARCLWPQGVDTLLSWFNEAEAEFHACGMTHVLGIVAAIKAFYQALDGRTRDAEAALALRQVRPADAPRTFWRERHLEGLARSLIAGSKRDDPAALAMADILISECSRDGRKAALAEAYLNRAQVLAICARPSEEVLRSLAMGVELTADLHIPGLLDEWATLLKRQADTLAKILRPAAAEMLERRRREWQGTVCAGLLSDREISVLKGVAAGLTNKQISRDFDVSVDTIKFHLKQCFRKLQVQNRAAAVQVARGAKLF